MAKQESLEGMELPDAIPEITAAAEAYVEIRDARLLALREETVKKEELLDLMHKHELLTYRDGDMVVTIEPKEKIKVKVGDGEEEEGE